MEENSMVTFRTYSRIQCIAVIKYKIIIFLALSVEHNKLNRSPQSNDMAVISQCVCVCIFASYARGHERHEVDYSRERSVNHATRKNFFILHLQHFFCFSVYYLISVCRPFLVHQYFRDLSLICVFFPIFPRRYRYCSNSGRTVII
jgi:hypothetical protein